MKKLLPILSFLSIIACDRKSNTSHPIPPAISSQDAACEKIRADSNFKGGTMEVLSTNDAVISCHNEQKGFIVNYGVNKKDDPQGDAQIKSNVELYNQLTNLEARASIKAAIKASVTLNQLSLVDSLNGLTISGLETVAIYNTLMIKQPDSIIPLTNFMVGYSSFIKVYSTDVELLSGKIKVMSGMGSDIIQVSTAGNIVGCQHTFGCTNPINTLIDYGTQVMSSPTLALDDFAAVIGAISLRGGKDLEELLVILRAPNPQQAVAALGVKIEKEKAEEKLAEAAAAEAKTKMTITSVVPEEIKMNIGMNELILSGTCNKANPAIGVSAEVVSTSDVSQKSTAAYTGASCQNGDYSISLDLNRLTLKGDSNKVKLSLSQPSGLVEASFILSSPMKFKNSLSFDRDLDQMEANPMYSIGKLFEAKVDEKYTNLYYKAEIISGGDVCSNENPNCNMIVISKLATRFDCVENPETEECDFVVAEKGYVSFEPYLRNVNLTEELKIKVSFYQNNPQNSNAAALYEEVKTVKVSAKRYVFTTNLKLAPESNTVSIAGDDEHYYEYSGECKANSFIIIYYTLDENEDSNSDISGYNYAYCQNNHYTLNVNSLLMKHDAISNPMKAKLKVFESVGEDGNILFESFVFFNHDYVIPAHSPVPTKE